MTLLLTETTNNSQIILDNRKMKLIERADTQKITGVFGHLKFFPKSNTTIYCYE